MLLLLLMGESVALEEAPASAQTAAASPAMLVLPLAAEPLSLRLGGEDVHLVLRTGFVFCSVLLGHGSGVKLLHSELDRSGLSLVTSGSCGGASGGFVSLVH